MLRRLATLAVIACAAISCGSDRQASAPSTASSDHPPVGTLSSRGAPTDPADPTDPTDPTGPADPTGPTAPPGASPGGTASTEPTAGPRIARFDAPAQVACDGERATITVSYETIDARVVAFAIDGTSATGATPPLSGEHQLEVPCDGTSHTVMLVAAGDAGPTVSARAVGTIRPG